MFPQSIGSTWGRGVGKTGEGALSVTTCSVLKFVPTKGLFLACNFIKCVYSNELASLYVRQVNKSGRRYSRFYYKEVDDDAVKVRGAVRRRVLIGNYVYFTIRGSITCRTYLDMCGYFDGN